MSGQNKIRFKFFAVVLLAVMAGLVAYPKAIAFFPAGYELLNKLKINLGLDLQGGIHLEYKADVSNVESAKIEDALQSAQDVIERRVNAFGVGEPLVQAAKSGNEHRIIVELPGIKDIEEAKKKIKDTPILEFRQEAGENSEGAKLIKNLNEQNKAKAEEIIARAKKGEEFEKLAKEFSQDPGSRDSGGDLGFVKKGDFVKEFEDALFSDKIKAGEVYPELVKSEFGWHIIKKLEEKGEGDNKEIKAEHILFSERSIDMFPELAYETTGLTGKNLKNSQVTFPGQGFSETQVAIQFDEEGTKMFADITKRNIGKPLAIFLDGQLQSAPTVQNEITNGEAVISGNFTIDQAKELVGRLNEGALPVPLTLVSQQSIEASLGEESLQKSLFAGMIGLAAVIVFMIFYYRFLGLVASFALLIYTALMISLFKFFPGITLTLSGIAGFILSIGMAVDANILIFERTKEEIRNGRSFMSALDEGFKRAWTSIRDGNVSSLITAAILYGMGTGFVKGFAATLGIGVLVSMFTAVVISKTLLKFVMGEWIHERTWLVGVKKKHIFQTK